MGNVSTRVTVSGAERDKILKAAQDQKKQREANKKNTTTTLAMPTVKDRKRKTSSETDKTPAKRRKPAA